jgi:phosphoserine phosphatase
MRAVMLVLTLVANEAAAAEAALARVLQALGEAGLQVKDPARLGPAAWDLDVEAPEAATIRDMALSALDRAPADVAVQPPEGRRKRLLIADMDSTIINVECLDELADFVGVKDRVSAITERAMRGELEFEGALRERLTLLEGLDLAAIGRCHEERVRLNPGARTLVQTMKAHGARCLLVSGGFTDFTDKIAEAVGFDEARANVLERTDGRLTGKVREPILGREAKLAALQEECATLGIQPAATLAVGDGANDLAMIRAAGLGAAYRAKPVVAAQADARVDHADLTALLYFQGYRQEEFVS